MVLNRLCGASALACALLLGTSAAWAKPCTAADRKAAEKLANQGFELYEASDYGAAADHFGRAEDRCHSPRLIVFMGKSEMRQGKLLRARQLFEKAAAEPITPKSPSSFREAQIEARKELETLRPRIPTLQVLVTGTPPESVKMSLDGEDLPIADLQRGRELDPGEHTLAAEAPGMERFVRHLNVREGVSERIELAMRAPADRPAPPGGDTAAPAGSRSIAPVVAAFGVGAVGLGVGAITGLVSAGKVSDIESRCIAGADGVVNQCLKSDAAEADSAKTLGTVSTIGFIVGGVGVAAGVTLLVLGEAGPASASSGRTLHVGAGPGSVRVGGTF